MKALFINKCCKLRKKGATSVALLPYELHLYFSFGTNVGNAAKLELRQVTQSSVRKTKDQPPGLVPTKDMRAPASV
jgi:hypothetical protein